MYGIIGKAAWRYGLTYMRRRYRRQIRIGAGVAAVGVGIAVYLANRDVAEG